MSLLSYVELVELVNQGVIQGVQPGAIQPASIDVRLGDTFMREVDHYTRHLDTNAARTILKPWAGRPVVDLQARDSVEFYEEHGSAILLPQDFALAHTIEIFNLPDHISCAFCLKSSLARNGLEHLNACWADAGFNSSVLTLELKNMTRHHDLKLTSGMFIGQLKFWAHTPVPPEFSYAKVGRYNGDSSVSAIKP